MGDTFYNTFTCIHEEDKHDDKKEKQYTYRKMYKIKPY